ncbi:hypothetical protein PV-S19_0423 [Pacmanvirus S19]|nr:hypothetical protein PV-S19_0423 [Pacmanvirus S19]
MNNQLIELLKDNSPENFENIANELLNNYDLSINGHLYKICEVEFYLKYNEHPDPYVHCDADQLTVGKWYFHKRGGTYKGGTFKCLDCTFAENAHGGILIRSVITPTGALIEGPCNTVNEILRVCNYASIRDFVVAEGINIINNKLTLVPALPRYDDVFSSKRVGLNPTTDINYADSPYRYVTNLKIKKERKNIIAGLVKNHGFNEIDAKKLIYNK